ncbi:3-hydroxyacyl-CoA dehydrogenase/enoyl-CoA hydratase family protein [Halocalculus aciditolerans]|uniref:enoyl-CoA hydratase n=1 Tax=Halocalculus aciditolerans TaxID=1383812 RepID=A0A830FHL9_9EURY|nr:3-hydroxyacyl-CoA dehydrogenase/enoyl-CoA hydratase family protein [Halocalculus aciditolerans]GGL53606.1 3-hydroxyacyl-CoA dehydrogenase [Halocalculus aciditolerans]
MDIDDVDSIAVLGAGSMGHGIAEVAALAGFDVTLRDIKAEFVEHGYEQVEWSLDKLVDNEQLTQDEADAALDRVTPVVDLEEAVSDVEFVIEAVPEKMDIKKNVYRELEQYAPEDAVFATNTSSLSVTELSEVTDRPQQFCGMHFFNPPIRMQLVEVIEGAHTLEETVDLAVDLARAMGKTPVRVHKDSPGFIVNRVLVPLLNEAAWIVHEGDATIAEVDSTTKYDIGLPMGAFELADQVGIDVAYDVLDYMQSVLGDAYEPCPLLTEKVDAGDLGKKSGQGFYDYEDGGADISADAVRGDVKSRVLAVMANETAKLVGNDVASADEVDEAVMLGAGFPEGPARMADDYGLLDLYETLADLYSETDEARYEAADELVQLASGGENFHHEVSTETEQSYSNLEVAVDDRVGHITLDRAHRMNTISAELLEEFEAAMDVLEADEEVRAILITGAGEQAFSAGADVQSMAGSADPLDAVELSRTGQQAFGRLEESDKPVVAGIDGYCLGGGMELAACADMRVASQRSTFGQPEHNLGLLPGWGGTQRLKHIVGEGRAKEIIMTAERYDADTMADYGFVNDVTPNDEFAETAMELARDLARGPPVAQRYTKRAFRAGRESTEAGLEAEALAFGQLMNTEDLMEGLTAFMGDRDPDFTGQ